MKPAIVALCVALVLGLSVPFGTALVFTAIVLPAAYQAASAACAPVEDGPGLPTPVTLAAGTEAPDCMPVTSELPPGPDGPCPPSGSAAEHGLRANTLRALRCVKQRFPWIVNMGGVGSRPCCYKSDHPLGLAVDFMIPAWNTPAGRARGWEVAHWLQAHAAELHVKYLIYRDRSWRAYSPSAGWRAYRYPGPNPGGADQRHLTHVHASFYN